MISNFKQQYAERYQDILHKALVGKEIASFRFEPTLRQGESVTRFKLDLSGVKVRTITPLVDRTIDPVSNSEQLLTIDQYKGTTFPISKWEKTLAGNPDLGLTIGKEVAMKVQEYLDASILAEVRNAARTFDAGDLTTTASTGVPVTLSTTTIPQMITQAKAKLGAAGVRSGRFTWVVDDYGLSMIHQQAIGRDTQMGDSVLQNGNSGNILASKVRVSDNLTGEAVLSLATQVTANDTVSIAGVTFTFVASPSVAGHVDIGADADGSRANLAAAINAGAGAGTAYIELSAANRAILDTLRITATNDNTANTLTVVGIGAGRLSVAETLTDGTDAWTKNFVHWFFGLEGSIDVVVQEEVDMKILQESKQDTVNILNDIIYGIKTFDDGAQTMLDVKVAA